VAINITGPCDDQTVLHHHKGLTPAGRHFGVVLVWWGAGSIPPTSTRDEEAPRQQWRGVLHFSGGNRAVLLRRGSCGAVVRRWGAVAPINRREYALLGAKVEPPRILGEG
jgi:hypothetical protein